MAPDTTQEEKHSKGEIQAALAAAVLRERAAARKLEEASAAAQKKLEEAAAEAEALRVRLAKAESSLQASRFSLNFKITICLFSGARSAVMWQLHRSHSKGCSTAAFPVTSR